MKTTIKVFFELAGLLPRDRFALHSNDIVKNEADTLGQELTSLAKVTSEEIIWQGDYPSFPRDLSDYHAYVLNELAPSTLDSLAEAIAPALNGLQIKVKNATQHLAKAISTSSKSPRVDSTWKYELKSRGRAICKPVSPPPGGHICELSVFYSSSDANSQELNWHIQSNGDVFDYAVHCSVHFQVEKVKAVIKHWSKEEITHENGIQNHDQCIANANSLHDFYDKELKSFPLFWSLIDFDKMKLAKIFVFFCESLRIQSTLGTKEIFEFLEERLSARWTKKHVSFPSASDASLERLSTALLAAFDELAGKDNLIGPAFELFASGALTSKRAQHMTKIVEDSSLQLRSTDSVTDEPEPDSGAHFFWGEFALLAASRGFQTERWKAILPFLLRSNRIFALCYGDPQKGVIPSNRKFVDYTSGPFTKLRPKVVPETQRKSSMSLSELEVEATATAEFAFPGEWAT